jgi:flagellar basal body-associated protein FliL
MDKEKPIFISYSSDNDEIAEAVCKHLEDNVDNCWMAPRDVKTADNYAKEIMDGLLDAEVFLLIFSKESQASDFVKEEIFTAFKNNKSIIAFNIDDTLPEKAMNFYLKNTQWLYAYPDPYEHLDELAVDVRRVLDGIYLGGKSTVVATVRDDDNNPIANASVTIHNDNGDYTGTTDANGECTISDIPNDNYALKTVANGYVENITSIRLENNRKVNISLKPESKRSLKIPIIIGVAIIIIAVVALVAFSGNGQDTTTDSNANSIVIDYIGVSDDGGTYYVYGTVSANANDTSKYKVQADFYDSSGKVVGSEKTKFSDIKGNTLSQSTPGKEVSKVSIELLDDKNNVLVSQESENVVK